MFAAVTSVALVGVEPQPVRVEVHTGGGSRAFSLVGLPDTSIREAKERVRAAFNTSGYDFPARRVTVNLSPADLPKVGSAYDLPIALGVLASTRSVAPEAAGVVALGELALDGGLRSARGGLAAALLARRLGLPCLLPPESAAEASHVSGADVRAVRSLGEAVDAALGDASSQPAAGPNDEGAPESLGTDLSEVRGQAVGRRALEVAAAGGHHLLFTGPPGAGKTLLARCLPGLLPGLGADEALEVAQAWAAAGRNRRVSSAPPFRAPHHSATAVAILGGGSGIPVPGELTLAHRGVLFLDELGEFPAVLLDALRQPLEEGEVRVARKGLSVAFPCATQVVAATNPCPCGYAGDGHRSCTCTPRAVQRYRRRLSGPLRDRFDVRVEVGRLSPAEMAAPPGEGSAAVRARVVAARTRQEERGTLNRDLSRAELDAQPWEPAAVEILQRSASVLALTGRGWDRVRRVARSIADLDESERILQCHAAEALGYRGDA